MYKTHDAQQSCTGKAPVMQHTAHANFNSSLDSELSCFLTRFSFVSCRQTLMRKAISCSNHCLVLLCVLEYMQLISRRRILADIIVYNVKIEIHSINKKR